MNPEFQQKRAAALAFVQKAHAGQTRVGDVPVWHHLDHVSRVLELVLDESQEGTPEERETVALAGLGHDALEDTLVTREEMLAVFGEHGLALIEGMTNRFGDDHPEPYVRQVAESEEGVRLIKLSDLYDNCTSVTYNLFALGTKWTEEYFLPIVTPMIEVVLPTRFSTYQKSAGRLTGMVRISFAILREELARYKAAGGL